MNGIVALTVYRFDTTYNELMSDLFGTVILDKTRLFWSYGVNLMNFFALAGFLIHLKCKLQKSNKEDDHL